MLLPAHLLHVRSRGVCDRAVRLCAAGLVFTHCSEPYLSSEYGANYITDSPVKLLDRLLHGDRSQTDEQVPHRSACHSVHPHLISTMQCPLAVSLHHELFITALSAAPTSLPCFNILCPNM